MRREPKTEAAGTDAAAVHPGGPRGGRPRDGHSEIPTGDVADQAQPLTTTGSETESEDTARPRRQVLVAEAEPQTLPTPTTPQELPEAPESENAESEDTQSGKRRRPLRRRLWRPAASAGRPTPDRACPRPSPDNGKEERGEMANFTAADIKTLREQIGAGMLDVKKALDEAEGDHAKAAEILRVKGLKGVTKREGRTASNGLVAAKAENGVGTLVEVLCETDFVAKSEKFIALAEQVLDQAIAAQVATPTRC